MEADLLLVVVPVGVELLAALARRGRQELDRELGHEVGRADVQRAGGVEAPVVDAGRARHRRRLDAELHPLDVRLGGALGRVGAEQLEAEQGVQVDDVDVPDAPRTGAVRAAVDAPPGQPATEDAGLVAVRLVDREGVPARQVVVAVGVVDDEARRGRLAVPRGRGQARDGVDEHRAVGKLDPVELEYRGQDATR